MMKCAKCIERGLKSTVYVPTGSVVTTMAFYPYYDEDGVYHNHDGNHHSETWSCTNGHRWHRSWQSKCPAPNCDWNKTAEDKITWDDKAP